MSINICILSRLLNDSLDTSLLFLIQFHSTVIAFDTVFGDGSLSSGIKHELGIVIISNINRIFESMRIILNG